MDDHTNPTRDRYDRVAEEYDQHIGDELDHKPLERDLLDRFAAGVQGRLGDLGCGPGHITRYLSQQGADAFGIDRSPGMIAQARRRNPALVVEQGDMRARADESLGALCCCTASSISRARK